MDDFELKFKKEIIDEAEDHLSALNDLLEALDDDEISQEKIYEMFRIVHSLKGNAMAAGFIQITNITHRYEELLLILKKEEIKYSKEIKSALLIFVGKLIDFCELLSTDFDAQFEDKELISNLESCLKSGNYTDELEINDSILVVDDEIELAEILATKLTDKFNMKIKTAYNGLEALELVKRYNFKFIVLDYRMPEMDGVQFMDALSKEPEDKSGTPVIMLSGYHPEGFFQKEWKNVFFLEKPVTDKQLFFKAKCCLKLSK